MRVATSGLLCALIAASCATGGKAGDGDDARTDAPATHQDASHVTSDAKVYLDAHVPPLDAKVFLDAPPVAADASTSGGLCSANNECTTVGECCFTVVCVPGTPLGDLCFPQ